MQELLQLPLQLQLFSLCNWFLGHFFLFIIGVLFDRLVHLSPKLKSSAIRSAAASSERIGLLAYDRNTTSVTSGVSSDISQAPIGLMGSACSVCLPVCGCCCCFAAVCIAVAAIRVAAAVSCCERRVSLVRSDSSRRSSKLAALHLKLRLQLGHAKLWLYLGGVLYLRDVDGSF